MGVEDTVFTFYALLTGMISIHLNPIVVFKHLLHPNISFMMKLKLLVISEDKVEYIIGVG